jgi:hypothetical protein
MKEVIRSGATVLFVSHNLKTVAEFCQRCLLLERGRPLMIGPVEQVISSYLNRPSTSTRDEAKSKQVAISKVRVRNQYGECSRFQSGEKAWIDVELRAHARASKLSLSIYITDDLFQEVFNTSTERLGHGNFALEAGDVFTCTLELCLNMASGVFHPSILVYRYDTETAYDRWAPATTIYVSSPDDVRGAVHCFPKVIRQEIHRVPDIAPETTAGATRVDWGHPPER